jgi:hypothetical protein
MIDADLCQCFDGIRKSLGVKNIVVTLEMFKPFEAFEISVSLTLPDAKMVGKLTDERHGMADDVSVFSGHEVSVYVAKVKNNS